MSDVEIASIQKQYRPFTDAEIVSRKFSISLIFFFPPVLFFLSFFKDRKPRAYFLASTLIMFDFFPPNHSQTFPLCLWSKNLLIIDKCRSKDFSVKGVLYKKMSLNLCRILSPFKNLQKLCIFLRKQLCNITSLCRTLQSSKGLRLKTTVLSEARYNHIAGRLNFYL